MASFWEKISVNGAEMDMYASVPSSSAGFSAPFPAVVVAQHATGVDEFIQDICDRLAAEGYAAVAPNLYHRHSDEAIEASAAGGPRPAPATLLSDPDIVADVNATVDWLLNHDAVQSDRIGVTGFCMGGRVAWLAAASNSNFRAVVPYYGGNIMTTWGAGQTPPFDMADNINCPMLFHFGEIDANPSQDDMQKLGAELSRLGREHTFHTYPDADHAFMNPAGGRYNEAAAVASWPRTLDFFAQHLKGSGIVGTGFKPAPTSVAILTRQTQSSPDKGGIVMASFWEKLTVDGSEMDMYASVPSSSAGFTTPYPAVIVSQHGGGVDEFIRTICDRLADEGYAAVAPNLYHRNSDEVMNADPRPRPWDVLSDPDIVADINATVDWLQNHDAVADRIGITGFCMGGRVAWLGAASNAHINAVAPYYGGNLLVTWGAGETPPFELAANINCPMLFHFGEVDENPSQDDMRKFDEELNRLGKQHQFYVYRDADHAFMDFTGPRYQKEAADRSWPRTLEFFAEHLKS